MTKLREKEASTALLFCRHGITDYPEDRFYPGGDGEDTLGPELNGEGKRQADRLAKYLVDVGQAACVYVSPTIRTRQTAAPFIRLSNLTEMVIPELRERDMGLWNGRSAAEVQQQDPEGWNRWKKEPLSFAPPGGETLAEFSMRIQKAVESILGRLEGKPAVVVTHVGPIRVITANALGIPLENCKRLVVAPGSVTRIHYTKSWPNLALFGYQP